MIPVDGDSRAAAQRWLQSLRLGGGQPLQIVDAVRPRRVGNLLDSCDLALFGGDDQLSDLRVRDPVFAAVFVEALTAGDAAVRLQAICRIIKATMDDFTIPRGSLEPDRIGTLENKNIMPSQRERPCRRE